VIQPLGHRATWHQIRAVLASRADLVDDARAATFSAALEQAEQLMEAAARVGPAARPLPLFYALSQAGRAIAAARLPADWELKGHGLSMVGPASTDTNLLERHVKSNASTADSFSRVAAAVGSGALTAPVELGALWSALPDLLFPGPPERRWRIPVRIVADDDGARDVMGLLGNKVIEASVMGFSAVEPDEARVRAELEHYPTAKGGQPVTVAGTDKVASAMVPGLGVLPRVRWSADGVDGVDPLLRLEEIAPEYRRLGERFGIPRLEQGDFLQPIMLWWALLFGLSSLARYEPGRWVDALQVDRSVLAVPLEVALEEALAAIPELVLSTLVGHNVVPGRLARWPGSIGRTKDAR